MIAFETMFILVFICVIAVMFFIIVNSLSEWHTNNNSPRLTVMATVVTKRMDVHHHHHHNSGNTNDVHRMHTTSNTVYYVTFQMESGDRIELKIKGKEYCLLVEGDIGKLTFQGTRYLGFEILKD